MMTKSQEIEKFSLENRRKKESGSPLSYLNMTSVFYTHSILSEPWGLKMPAIPMSTMFHLVLDGKANVSVNNKNIQLNKGDFILIPKGVGHTIVDQNNTRATDLFENRLEQITEHYERLQTKGKGPLTTTLCGTVLFDKEITKSIIESMPDYILISSQSSANPAIRNTVKELNRELKTTRSGSGLIVPRLADLLILHCIRAWIDSLSEGQKSWIMAYTDKRLGDVMKKIHNSPSERIDIEVLASISGMSRTGFIQHFKDVVGCPPKQYISNWRLSLARERINNSKDHILNIALEVGYQSESSFSRAYKNKYGESPSSTRKSIN
jgi:AraC-like DNA-binding protein